jgi:Na+/H+ antiporter NhaD/arsenite permease-like protein
MSKITKHITYLSTFILFSLPQLSHASASEYVLDLTSSPFAIIALLVFALAYIIVFFEEYLHIQKSKPMILASGIIWSLVAYAAYKIDASDTAIQALNGNLLEYIQLALFLLVAMTYINAMEERQVFAGLRSWLVSKKFSYRQLFIITGVLAFFISPVADNLTTALFMCAVLMAVGKDSPRLITLGCINIVVAANAGGAFSPFGDITTLMVWQAGAVEFTTFFKLFVPAVVNFAVPALIMLPAVPKGSPIERKEHVVLKPGALAVVILFFASMTTSVMMHYYLHLPAVIGMMTGLGFLQLYGYYLNHLEKKKYPQTAHRHQDYEFDIFKRIAAVEWDTLLFFYGVVLCVGGLGALGYLAAMSTALYDQLGPALGFSGAFSQTPANIMIGIMSAIIDNIPIMFAVLAMEPVMSEGQWLLVTLTAGVGGSMLSIGSAAGVGLMGQARGFYTFFSHLKWAWAVALGYFASIAVHIWINYSTF